MGGKKYHMSISLFMLACTVFVWSSNENTLCHDQMSKIELMFSNIVCVVKNPLFAKSSYVHYG